MKFKVTDKAALAVLARGKDKEIRTDNGLYLYFAQGKADGTIENIEKVPRRAIVITCHPQAVARRYPFLTVLGDWPGMTGIKVTYPPGEIEVYDYRKRT